MKKLFVLLSILALASCQASNIPEELSALPIASSTHIQAVISDFTPIPKPEMNPLVEIARQDLAIRLKLDPQLVTTIDVQSVTWPDSSLGCPQDGMMYAQVLTDGNVIRLESIGVIYTYHTDTIQQVLLCEKPQLPVFRVTPGEIKDDKPWMPVEPIEPGSEVPKP